MILPRILAAVLKTQFYKVTLFLRLLEAFLGLILSFTTNDRWKNWISFPSQHWYSYSHHTYKQGNLKEKNLNIKFQKKIRVSTKLGNLESRGLKVIKGLFTEHNEQNEENCIIQWDCLQMLIICTIQYNQTSYIRRCQLKSRKSDDRENLQGMTVLMSLPISCTSISFLVATEASESTQELLLMHRLLHFIFRELRNAYSFQHTLGENNRLGMF